jgi:hypothetical protein
MRKIAYYISTNCGFVAETAFAVCAASTTVTSLNVWPIGLNVLRWVRAGATIRWVVNKKVPADAPTCGLLSAI